VDLFKHDDIIALFLLQLDYCYIKFVHPKTL